MPTNEDMAAGAGLEVPHAGGAVLGERDRQAAVAADKRRVDSPAVHAAGVPLSPLLQCALQLHKNEKIVSLPLRQLIHQNGKLLRIS